MTDTPWWSQPATGGPDEPTTPADAPAESPGPLAEPPAAEVPAAEAPAAATPAVDPWSTTATATLPTEQLPPADDPAWQTPYRPAAPEAPYAPYEPYGVPQADTLGRPPKERGRGGRIVAGALALTLLAGTVGGAAGWYFAERSDQQLTDSGASLGGAPAGDLARDPESVAGIAAAVLPTVVSIAVRSGTSGSTGSGFVIRADGYVLTNNHVVEAAADGAGEITVTFQDGSREKAEIVGRSTSYDLAVLKVGRTGLATSTLGNSDGVVQGDSAIAIGSPLGLSGTVTSGIISALNRPVTAGGDTGSDRSFIAALQTDAAINPGNSGGPLVDANGAVIGVNSAIATLGAGQGSQTGSIGLGFAIPINQARRVAEQLIATGTASYPIVGATLDSTYQGQGARIAAVDARGNPGITAGGPADQAGLQPGDVITAVDGATIQGADELIVAIRAKAPGDTIGVTYLRGDEERTATITLGEATD